MDGKLIKAVHFPDDANGYGQILTPRVGEELVWVNKFHGDHDDTWIALIRNGKEVERYNPRYLVCIEWQR